MALFVLACFVLVWIISVFEKNSGKTPAEKKRREKDVAGIRPAGKRSNRKKSPGKRQSGKSKARKRPITGKPRYLGASYMTISLLSPAIKNLERHFLPQLVADLLLAVTKRGFHKKRFTTPAVLYLTQKVVEGFNEEKPL